MKGINKIYRLINGLITLAVLAVPFLLLAEGVPPDPGPKGITNPLSNISDIPTLITTIVDAVKTIGYYVVVVFVIYSGFKFVSARGNDKELGEAKQMFLWTVIGAAVLLGASILSNVIKNTVTEVGGVSAAVVEQTRV